MSLSAKDCHLKRFTLHLPINDNTRAHIDAVLYSINKFTGCTFSRYHIPPVSLGVRSLYGYFIGRFEDYPDEDVCIITFDVAEAEHDALYGKIKPIIEMIRALGEKVVWLTYHDIMRDAD